MTRRSLRTALAAALAEASRGELSLADTADLIADIIEAHREEAAEPAPADRVVMSSVISLSSGDPFVQCRVGAEEWQWDPATARGHAAHLLEVAEAAVHDAATLRWMQLGTMGLDRDIAIAAIQDLRRYRGDSTA